MTPVDFEQELASILPEDLPHRDSVIFRSALHLRRIMKINAQFNLTRITGPSDAAIKHVLDSVLPWRHFAEAKHVVDAGTGAGFPGIPLALVLPETRFSLTESTGKKARFVESAVADLGLSNVIVANARVEDVLRSLESVLITGRAVAPLSKACALFGPAIRAGSRALLYKGPDAEAEIVGASPEALKRKLTLRVIERYTLPGAIGVRTLVEINRIAH